MQLTGDPAEFLHGEHVKAPFLPFRDHQATCQFVAKLRRKDQPSLFVKLGSVGTEKHRYHSPGLPAETGKKVRRRRQSPTSALHLTPLSSTAIGRFGDTSQYAGSTRQVTPVEESGDEFALHPVEAYGASGSDNGPPRRVRSLRS